MILHVQCLFLSQNRIEAKKDDVLKSHEKTKMLLNEREDALKQSKEFHQFHADIEEVWTALFSLTNI